MTLTDTIITILQRLGPTDFACLARELRMTTEAQRNALAMTLYCRDCFTYDGERWRLVTIEPKPEEA